jgi:hypothetical protein
MDRVHLLQASAISVTANTIIPNRATTAIPQVPGTINEIAKGTIYLEVVLVPCGHRVQIANFPVHVAPDMPVVALEKKEK